MTAKLETMQSAIVTLISSSVDYLRDVVELADAEEMGALAKNPPAAGVVLELPGSSGPAPADSQYLLIPVLVVMAARSFRSGQDALTGATGIYQIFEDVYAALVGETPTGAFEPIKYLERAEPLSIGDGGVVVGLATFQTTIIL